MASLGYGLGSGRSLPLTVFSLSDPFVSRVIAFIYDVRVRGVVSWASVPRSVVVTAKWVVSCTQITCIQPLSRCSLTFPASSFFSESVCLLLLLFHGFLTLLFHHTSFVFISMMPFPHYGVWTFLDVWLSKILSLHSASNIQTVRGILKDTNIF